MNDKNVGLTFDLQMNLHLNKNRMEVNNYKEVENMGSSIYTSTD
jgi:hypothetical protein